MRKLEDSASVSPMYFSVPELSMYSVGLSVRVPLLDMGESFLFQRMASGRERESRLTES